MSGQPSDEDLDRILDEIDAHYRAQREIWRSGSPDPDAEEPRYIERMVRERSSAIDAHPFATALHRLANRRYYQHQIDSARGVLEAWAEVSARDRRLGQSEEQIAAFRLSAERQLVEAEAGLRIFGSPSLDERIAQILDPADSARDQPAFPLEARGLTVEMIRDAYDRATAAHRKPTREHVCEELPAKPSAKTLQRAQEELGIPGWPPPPRS